MIRVVFDPAALQDPEQTSWWSKWQKRADAATGQAIDAFEEWLAGKHDKPFKFEFNNDIWKDLKNWLMEHVFYERCAYCERLISGFYGDAEHYRPKGAVRRKSATGDLVDPDCGIINPSDGQHLTLGHPGYFWLAYDWRNLVPSCQFCNSGLGKNDRFDIDEEYVVMVKLDRAEVNAMPAVARPRPSKMWSGYYYLSPASLDEREHPLLLNPLNATEERNPHKHIRFGVRGIITAVDESPVGKTSIEVFQLRNEKLRLARQKAQGEFRDKFYDRMRRYDPDSGEPSEAEELLTEYSQGRHPFSAAALDYYEILCKALPASPQR